MRRILTLALLASAVLAAVGAASIFTARPAYAPLSQPRQGHGG